MHFGMSRDMDVHINIEHNDKIIDSSDEFSPLNSELNPICHFLALLGSHHILHVSRIRVKIYCTVLHWYLEGGVTTQCVV